MAVSPTGTESKLIDNLRALVAASATFQAWVGHTGDAAAAKGYVFIDLAASAISRPYAIVGADPGTFDQEAIAGGARNYFTFEAGLELIFEAAITQSDSVDALYEFTNKTGAIVAEIRALAGSGGYLNVTGIMLTNGPARVDKPEESGDESFYQSAYKVTVWGI